MAACLCRDTKVTESSESVLAGTKRPPFRLYCNAVVPPGANLRIRPAVSEEFVVRCPAADVPSLRLHCPVAALAASFCDPAALSVVLRVHSQNLLLAKHPFKVFHSGRVLSATSVETSTGQQSSTQPEKAVWDFTCRWSQRGPRT